MKRNILLYNLAVDTTDDDKFHKSFSIPRKLGEIATKLDEMERELRETEYKETKGAPIRAIFVAPEYFFARSAPEYYAQRLGLGWSAVPQDRRGRHYEHKEYIQIRKGLTQLSERHKQILIIPGTIAWKEKEIAQDIAPPTSSSSSHGAQVPSWKPGARMNKEQFVMRMRSMGEEEHHIQADWLLYERETPDTKVLRTQKSLRAEFASLLNGAGITLEGKKKIIDKITSKTMTTQGYDDFIFALEQTRFGLAWNTAYFYLGGNKVWEYSKHSDYQESVYYQELSVAVNHDGPSICEIHGLTIGIEICLDHAYDVLKKYISTTRCKKPTIHLILSACVENKGSQGQVLIHSSSFIHCNRPAPPLTIKENERCYLLRGSIDIEFPLDQDNFQKFKERVGELVKKQYKFQIIKRSAGHLRIVIRLSDNNRTQELDIAKELAQLTSLFSDALNSRRIQFSFNRNNSTLFHLDITSPMHGERVENLLVEAGFRYLPKEIQDRNTLFSSSSSSINTFYKEDPRPFDRWQIKEKEDSLDSSNIISCALQ